LFLVPRQSKDDREISSAGKAGNKAIASKAASGKLKYVKAGYFPKFGRIKNPTPYTHSPPGRG